MRLPLSSLHRLRLGAAVLLAGLALPAGASADRITEYPIGQSLLGVTDLVRGPGNTLWGVRPGGSPTSLSRFAVSAAVPNLTETAVALSGVDGDVSPQSIAFAANALWVSEGSQPRIIKINPTVTAGTPATSAATVITDGIDPAANVGRLATGPAESVWFAQGEAGKIGRIAADGVVTEFSAAVAGGAALTPEQLTLGPDGAMWFTDQDNPVVGRLDPATGAVTTVALPAPPGVDKSTGITRGPDGNVWVTTDQSIERINTLSKAVTSFTAGLEGSGILDITVGPDDNLWFTDPTNKRVGRITISGAIRFFSLTGGLPPTSITTGPDGNLWFAGVLPKELPFLTRLARVEPTAPPTALAKSEVTVTTASAAVTGEIGPEGLATTAYAEYGPTTAYGSRTPDVTNLIGIDPRSFLAEIANLSPGTTYHFRLVARNAKGTVTSEDRAFTTDALPPVPKTDTPTPPASIAQTPFVPAPVPAPSLLKPAATKVKITAKGILALPLACSGGSAACTAGILLTAKVAGKKSATIGTKTGTFSAGKTTKLNIRLSKAGIAAVKRGNKKGLSALVTVTQGPAKVRYRLVIIKG